MDSLKHDPRPFYLGYHKGSNSYYVYAMKDGAPRFLRFVSYWHWSKAPEEILKLVPIPIEIESDLVDFLSGKLNYEFFSKRKNSKEQSVRKTYRTFDCDGLEPRNEPNVSSGSNENPSNAESQSGDDPSDRKQRRIRRSAPGNSDVPAVVEVKDVDIAPASGGAESRKSRRSKSVESVRSSTSLTPDRKSETTPVQVKIPTKSDEAALRKGRGRSKSVLDNQTEAPPSGSGSLRDLHEEVSKPRRGRIPKSK